MDLSGPGIDFKLKERKKDGLKFLFLFSFCNVKSFANSFQIIRKINPIYTRKTTLFFSIWGVLHFYDESYSVPIPN
jgi:hypothetical protein